MVHKGITEATAENVRNAIAAAGVSHRQVALRSGMAPSTLERKLSGYTDFTLGELARIATVLEVATSSLLPDLDAAA